MTVLQGSSDCTQEVMEFRTQLAKSSADSRPLGLAWPRNLRDSVSLMEKVMAGMENKYDQSCTFQHFQGFEVCTLLEEFPVGIPVLPDCTLGMVMVHRIGNYRSLLTLILLVYLHSWDPMLRFVPVSYCHLAAEFGYRNEVYDSHRVTAFANRTSVFENLRRT